MPNKEEFINIQAKISHFITTTKKLIISNIKTIVPD